jgi:lipid-A-disaccharide synthase
MSLALGLVAGEPSGDMIAARVLAGLQSVSPSVNAYGIGGPALVNQGLELWHPMHALTVFGYVDALKRLPSLIKTFKDVEHRLIKQAPDVFLGIDAPDFNLKLENKLKRRGIPTVHLVGPSIWAWRYERIKFIKEAVSHMLVLFPFEQEIYEKERIPVTYVGHPLADAIALKPNILQARSRIGLESTDRVVAILPGSRSSEIKVLAPRFLASAELLFAKDPRLVFIVPMVNEARRLEFEQIAKRFKLPSLRILSSLENQAYSADQQTKPVAWDALEACDVALVASGTATLEAALFKKPMVISYYLPTLMRRIMAWKSGQERPYLDWVGLPNILARDFIVPELLQDEATPEKLSQAVWSLLLDEKRQKKIADRFTDIHLSLQCDTAKLAAQVILQLADAK